MKQKRALTSVEAKQAELAAAEKKAAQEMRLISAFDDQIRVVRNGYRATKAVLLAEKATILLMVELKRDLNAEEELGELAAKKQANGSLDAADTKREEALGELRKTLKPKLEALTTEATKRGATALTIDSVLANEEAAFKLGRANAKLAELQVQATEVDASIKMLQTQISMSASASAKKGYEEEVTRWQATKKGIEDLKKEQDAIVADVKKT